MRRRGVAPSCLAGMLCMTAACAGPPPTETTVPLNVKAGRSDIVAVCYDSGDHGRKEIEAIALEACGKGFAAVTPWRIDKVFNDCPLFKKTRVSFICVPVAGRSNLR